MSRAAKGPPAVAVLPEWHPLLTSRPDHCSHTRRCFVSHWARNARPLLWIAHWKANRTRRQLNKRANASLTTCCRCGADAGADDADSRVSRQPGCSTLCGPPQTTRQSPIIRPQSLAAMCALQLLLPTFTNRLLPCPECSNAHHLFALTASACSSHHVLTRIDGPASLHANLSLV